MKSHKTGGCQKWGVGEMGEGDQKGMTEDEMVGWHHRLNGHEFG